MNLKTCLLIPISFIGLYNPCIAKQPIQSATLIVIDPHAQEKDSMTLYLWDEYLIRQVKDFIPIRKFKVGGYGKKYEYEIKSITEIKYFTLCKGETDKGRPMPLLEYYFIEPGDSIVIELSQYAPKIQRRGSTSTKQIGWTVKSLTFSGSGFAKMECKSKCNLTHSYSGSVLELQNFNLLDSVTKVRLEIINEYKPKLSKAAYQLLRLDAVGRLFQARGFQDTSKKVFERYSSLLENVPDHLKIRSNEYFESQFLSLKIKYPSLNFEQLYWAIKKDFTGELRNKLITTLLLFKYSSLNNGEELVNDALNEVKSSFFRQILFDLSEFLAEGTPAYNFSLPDHKGNIVRLSDLKGKVVVLDFWYNKCGACQDYYVYQLSKVEEKYKEDPEVVFVTINIDKDRNLWIDGIKDGKHTSPEVINLNTGERGSDHPVIKHYKIIGYPRPIVIDKESRVYRANGKDLRIAEKLSSIIESAKNKNKTNQR